MREKYHISVAIFNMGAAEVPIYDEMHSITMGGKDAAKLVSKVNADILVPIHFESWFQFTEYEEQLRKVFEEEGISDKVCWLTPGGRKKVQQVVSASLLLTP